MVLHGLLPRILILLSLVPAETLASQAQKTPGNEPDQFRFEMEHDFDLKNEVVKFNEANDSWVGNVVLKESRQDNMEFISAVLKITHAKPPAGEPHEGEGSTIARSVATILISTGAVNSKLETSSKLTVKHVNVTDPIDPDHHDLLFIKLSATTSDTGRISKYTLELELSHTTMKEDGDIKVRKEADEEFAGGSSSIPEAKTWGPNGFLASRGTVLIAILDNVDLEFAVSQPVLLFGDDEKTAFDGSVELPLDLTRYGAPGFNLFVDPQAMLPGQPPSGPYHAEVAFIVPNDIALLHKTFYFQWVVHDPGANALGLTFSEGNLIAIVP